MISDSPSAWLDVRQAALVGRSDQVQTNQLAMWLPCTVLTMQSVHRVDRVLFL